MFFGPFTFLFFLIFLGLLGFLFAFVHISVITFAFERIGIGQQHLFGLLFLTLVGSYINIPVYRIRTEIEPAGQLVNFFGFRFLIPQPLWERTTTVAVNVGGALVPTLVSLYLIWQHPQLLPKIILLTALMAMWTKKLSRPIRGLGIATRPFIVPFVTALSALILWREHAPIIAYTSGTLGVLIGADLLNWKYFDKLGAPVVSIGGAGTFDGVFLTGILAVLLTAF